jgi:hypothetical protein
LASLQAYNSRQQVLFSLTDLGFSFMGSFFQLLEPSVLARQHIFLKFGFSLCRLCITDFWLLRIPTASLCSLCLMDGCFLLQ